MKVLTRTNAVCTISQPMMSGVIDNTLSIQPVVYLQYANEAVNWRSCSPPIWLPQRLLYNVSTGIIRTKYSIQDILV